MHTPTGHRRLKLLSANIQAGSSTRRYSDYATRSWSHVFPTGKRANLQGISVGSTQMFEAMNRAISANKIKPVIDKVFGFDDVKAAYQHMASGAHFGKIVIRVGG